MIDGWVQLQYHWQWGDKSNIFYNLDRSGDRKDLMRFISDIKNTPEITHYEFFVSKRITQDEVVTEIERLNSEV